jgi:hypothetical protein
MFYFTTRDITAIAMCAALWGVLSSYFAPVFWTATHLPFFCDMLGIILLILVMWWVRKFGAITMTGIIATIITLMLNPYATHFFGFTAASVVFDILTRLIRCQNSPEKSVLKLISVFFTSLASTAVAGVIIGYLFMNTNFLMATFGGIAFFVVLHVAGGAIGGTIGLVLIKALSTRINLQKM